MPTFVDLFCGGGFGARGAVRGGGVPLMALDAWEVATKTYKANFPGAEVLTSTIERTNVLALSRRHRPDVLLTSPECTSHSIARGSKSGSESSRETAIGIIPWVKAMKPRWVIVENVNRMKKWNRHDELVRTLEDQGYTVSDLFLNSADFGAAQARKRMFLVCDRKGSRVSASDLLPRRVVSRRSAHDVIDWSGRYPTKPLYRHGRAFASLERAERAIAAIGRGVPFLIVYYGSDYAGGWQTIDAPLRTVTTVDRFGLVTWEKKTPHLRMLQPEELVRAMGGRRDHVLPYGNRREKVKLCGNGVSAEVMTSIFRWIAKLQSASAA